MDTHELAWAAGFFDGEGCADIARNSQQKEYLRLVVRQKDRRPLERFQAAVGGVGAIHGPYSRGNPCPCWKVVGSRAEQVAKLLWPYLSEPKREQLRRAGHG